jgi:uncharacterized repeat protein (TIGR03803 family)
MNRKNLASLVGACALAFSAPVSAGSLTVLHTFTGKSDGMTPFAGLTADGQGNFYGTTYEGGGKSCYPNGCGTVYRIAADGSFMSLYAFKGGTDGAYPHAGLTLGPDGALYGVTQGGRNLDACLQVGCGTLFRLKSDGTKTTLYKFKGGTGDGEEPNGAVVFDRKGNLYGTTWFGGDIGSGYGTIYKLSPEGQETMLYAFKDDGHDGMEPMGKLAVDKAGNLYGTTRVGGSAGAGTVFKLTAQGEESLLRISRPGWT